MGITISDPIPQGWSNNKFNLISNHTGTAMDVGGPENGHNVWGWGYDESNDNQVWLLTCIDTNANIWTIENPRTGHFLDIHEGSCDNGAQLAAFGRNDVKNTNRHNQEFYIFLVDGASGSARICMQNVMSGTFINMLGGNTSNGAKIGGWPWDATNCCVWRLVQQI